MTDPFEIWLYANHYRRTTTRKTLADVKHARGVFDTGGELEVRTSWRESLQRYANFVGTHGAQTAFDRAVTTELAPTTRQRHAPKGPRKRPAVSFADAEWAPFFAALERSTDPEGRVLCVQFITGHRISDVLGIERARLKTALRTGILQLEIKGGRNIEVPVDGARDVWEGLYKAWPTQYETFAAWVCPRGTLDGMGAYQRVNRYMKALGTELGIDSRIHTHRIRRTVGVHTLKLKGDIHLVQQMLGHKSIASTQPYVDELRTADITAMQQSLRKKSP